MLRTVKELSPIFLLLGLLELSIGRLWGWWLVALALVAWTPKLLGFSREIKVRRPPKKILPTSLGLTYLSAMLLAWLGFCSVNYGSDHTLTAVFLITLMLISAMLCAHAIFNGAKSASDRTQQRPTPSAGLWLPLGIVFGALLLRFFWVLDVPGGFSARELWLADASQTAFPPGAFSEIGDYLAHLFVRLTNPSVYSLRLPAVLLGTLSVAAVFLLGRLLLPGRGAALAAITLAVMPCHFVASRVSGAWIGASLAIPLALGAAIAVRKRAILPPLVLFSIPALLVYDRFAYLQTATILLLLFYTLPQTKKKTGRRNNGLTIWLWRAGRLSLLSLLALPYGKQLAVPLDLLFYRGLNDAVLGFGGMGPIGPALLPLFLIGACAFWRGRAAALFPGSVYLLTFLIAFQPAGTGTRFALALLAPLVAVTIAAALLKLEKELRGTALLRTAHRILLVLLSVTVIGWGYFKFYADDAVRRGMLDYRLHRLVYYLDAAKERNMTPYLSSSLQQPASYAPFLKQYADIKPFNSAFSIPVNTVLILDGKEDDLYHVFDAQETGIYRREVRNGPNLVLRVIYRPKTESEK